MCEAFGCQEETNRKFPFCKHHWTLIPNSLKHALNKNFTIFQDVLGSGVTPTKEYKAIVAEGIEIIKNLDIDGGIPCPECGGKQKLHRILFGSNYVCSNWPTCKGVRNVFQDGGHIGRTDANVIKASKIMAHNAFDSLWTSELMSRNDAYEWLRKELGISRKKCHISMFDDVTCEKTHRLCVEKLESLV